jgi:uncharacterized protein (DUF2225 family)
MQKTLIIVQRGAKLTNWKVEGADFQMLSLAQCQVKPMIYYVVVCPDKRP